MKIFPPISEILWPPGYEAKELLWARRYFVLAVAGIAFAVSAQTLLLPTANLPGVGSSVGNTAMAHILVDGANCQDLRLQHATGTTAGRPCGQSFRMKAGASLIADQPLPRSTLTTSQGTLTTADIAITPPKALRTSIWKQRPDTAQTAPALAQSSKQE